MKTKENYHFEFLAIDNSGKSEIESTRSMLMGLSYSDKIWENPSLSTTGVDDKDLGIAIKVQKVAVDGKNVNAFSIKVKSTKPQKAEEFKTQLVVHLKDKLGFDQCTMLVDETSQKALVEMRPIVTELEDAMRVALGTFLVDKLGANWWKNAAPANVQRRIKVRIDKFNISHALDANITLTDAQDLTDIIIANIKDKTVNDNWLALMELREKLSFHFPFTNSDVQKFKGLTKSLKQTISQLESGKVAAVAPTPAKKTSSKPKSTKPKAKATSKKKPTEKKAIKKSSGPAIIAEKTTPIESAKVIEQNVDTPKIVAPKIEEPKTEKEVVAETPTPAPKPKPKVNTNDFAYNIISEADLLSEIKAAEVHESGFIDLKELVTTVIGPKGYATGPTYSMARNMNEKGILEIYDAKDEKGFTIQAVRSK